MSSALWLREWSEGSRDVPKRLRRATTTTVSLKSQNRCVRSLQNALWKFRSPRVWAHFPRMKFWKLAVSVQLPHFPCYVCTPTVSSQNLNLNISIWGSQKSHIQIHRILRQTIVSPATFLRNVRMQEFKPQGLEEHLSLECLETGRTPETGCPIPPAQTKNPQTRHLRIWISGTFPTGLEIAPLNVQIC